MQIAENQAVPPGRSSAPGEMKARWAAAAAIAVVLVGGVATLVLRGDGGEGRSSGSVAGTEPSRLLGPAQFGARIGEPGVVTINVHVPDEGSIPGTTQAIPYDRVEAMRAELPPKETPLAIYCRSGRMSAIAARTLATLGYERIFELAGGMDAWVESGRRLLPPA